MDVALPYGTQTRIVTVPDDTVVVRSQPLPALVEAHQAFESAIAHPIGTPALVDLVGSKDQVAIIISDGTRPTPNHLLVPWLLKALAHIPREQIVILVGTGSHRAMTQEELRALLGDEVVATIAISNHDATDESNLSFVGNTATEVPVWVNRLFVTRGTNDCRPDLWGHLIRRLSDRWFRPSGSPYRLWEATNRPKFEPNWKRSGLVSPGPVVSSAARLYYWLFDPVCTHPTSLSGASSKGWRSGCCWLGSMVSQIDASGPCCSKRPTVVARISNPASAQVHARRWMRCS